ncbi:MAG: PA14 domain-containing protein [Ginsengibacter sp.]
MQNKKAASLQQIVGFGNSTNLDLNNAAVNQLYKEVVGQNVMGKQETKYIDNEYIYIKLPYPVNQGNAAEKLRELTARYFENTKQLYMKLAVTVPSGKNIPGLAGNEIIPVYADIASFGLIDSANGLSSTVAWVKVKKVENDMTPMAQQALQFLKQQLPGKAYKGYDLSENSGMKSVLLALAGMVASFKALKAGDDNVLKQEGKCKTVSLDRSFARLTDPYMQKLGGGLRVKQVIINDNWNKMSGQYESTYGQEYKYTTKELINNKLCTISSGVAAWEPSIGADENPHNEIMRFQNHNKGGPYDFGAIMMPLGEAFYPAPMVGYSRVEVLSIHRDAVKNLPTRQVTEFYTTKDFPFKSAYTSLIDPQAKSKLEPNPILQLLNLDMAKGITLSQGFLVDMNDMNGKEKIQATYSALDSVTPVSYTQNFYNVEEATDNTYTFNHNLPTIASAEGKVGNSIIGRDIELMADFREHTSETSTTNISPNFDLFFVGIFPVPLTNLLQPTIHEMMTYRSASLLKIVNHYGVLDSVMVIDKGSMVSTKNLVYDAETGSPLLTRTNNEHNQPIYNFRYPAHWAYSGMGQAYKNIDATYRYVNFSHGQLMSMPGYDINYFLNNVLESGDELYVVAENNDPIDKDMVCDKNPGTDPWTTLAKNKENKIWAVNTGKASLVNPQWIFMDRDGIPYNAKGATIRIVRSGHRNMLDQNVGSVTSMAYPVKNNGQLKFNDAANIIQTGAATFKDHWRVDNSFYMVDSVVAVKVPVTVRKLEFDPIETLTELVYKRHDINTIYASAIDKQNYFMAEQSATGWKLKLSRHYLASFVKYDLNSIPSDATILVARLSLIPHHEFKRSANYVLKHKFPVTLNKFNGVSNGKNPGIDDADHYNYAPLQNNYPFSPRRQGNNIFKFTRFNKDWPSINSSSGVWLDYIKNYANRGVEGPTIHEGTERGGSFIISTDGCVASADVSSLVKKMVINKSVPSIIGMELNENINYYFADGYPEYAHPSTKVCFYPPKLSVYYYTCSDNNTYAAKNGISTNVSIPNVPIPSCDPTFPQFYCTTYQHRIFCFSKFTERKSVNPYTEGILGNWRVDTTFAYYGDRKESDPTVTVDTRTAGTIANYKDFWDLSGNADGYLSRNIINKNVWVWNSTITQYNRKGYEIENKDPLGRFNAGLYGYNQQLPVAVINNSRVREALFDGFEDYDYNTAQNCVTCKPHRSFNYSKDILNNLDASQHHTGLKSLRVDAGQSISIVAPVTDILTADKDYGLRMRIDSVRYKDTAVVGRGTGLRGQYIKYYKGRNNYLCSKKNLDPTCIASHLQTGPYDLIQNVPAISFLPQSHIMPGFGDEDYISVRWRGYIQATSTGNYYFETYSDDGVKLTVDGSILINNWNVHPRTINKSSARRLVKGNTYSIQLDYFNYEGKKEIQLLWKTPEMQEYETIPTQQMYLPNRLDDAAAAVTISDSKWCTRLDSVNVRGNAVTDTFSLLQNKKMLVSAWVKEGGNDCKCSSYVKNNITVSFTGAPGNSVMHPTGSIIEGWQRYEEEFVIPTSATGVKVSLNNTTDGPPVYFDDIRIHPFNANMKSFVYHASNLRLMNELDENNYATFYEYDDDGTLTRVKKETERGIKTITETRSAMQKVINDEP